MREPAAELPESPPASTAPGRVASGRAQGRRVSVLEATPPAPRADIGVEEVGPGEGGPGGRVAERDLHESSSAAYVDPAPGSGTHEVDPESFREALEIWSSEPVPEWVARRLATDATPPQYAPFPVEVETTVEIPAQGTYMREGLRVDLPLGAGGMGVVLLATDELLDRRVAIKLLQRPRDGDTSLLMEEARAMASFRDPHVVQVFDAGEFEGQPYFVMEYIAGGSLEQYLAQRDFEALSLDEAYGVLAPISRGVDAIHRAGLLHGDLKPANVLIGEGFQVFVSDFGLARNVADLDPALAGTPAYTAPERIRRENLPTALRARADLYALGVIAYEVLTGVRPFDAPDAARTEAQHLYKTPPLIDEVRPELPHELALVIDRYLAKDPCQRPVDGRPLRKALADSHDGVHAPVRRRVLIIDDDPHFRALLATLISGKFPGHHVAEAGRGELGLAVAREEPFDLAIVDLALPDLNGLELTAALRQLEDAPRVLIVTGEGKASDWRVLQQMGAEGFLVKPLDADTFLVSVERLLGS